MASESDEPNSNTQNYTCTPLGCVLAAGRSVWTPPHALRVPAPNTPGDAGRIALRMFGSSTLEGVDGIIAVPVAHAVAVDVAWVFKPPPPVPSGSWSLTPGTCMLAPLLTNTCDLCSLISIQVYKHPNWSRSTQFSFVAIRLP